MFPGLYKCLLGLTDFRDNPLKQDLKARILVLLNSGIEDLKILPPAQNEAFFFVMSFLAKTLFFITGLFLVYLVYLHQEGNIGLLVCFLLSCCCLPSGPRISFKNFTKNNLPKQIWINI